MSVFVYGTLKTGECRCGVFDTYLKKGFKVVPGTIKAELFDLGPYPGILKGDDVVRGELITLEDESEMKQLMPVLDGIEGYRGEGYKFNLYNREVVTVSTDDGDVKASTYFYADDKRLRDVGKYLPNGTWGKACAKTKTTGAGE